MFPSYARAVIFATVGFLTACSSVDPAGSGGSQPIGCDTAADCGDTHPDVCVECRNHECAVYSGACVSACGAVDPCHVYSTANGGCEPVGVDDGPLCNDGTSCVNGQCTAIACSTVADCYFYPCANTSCVAGSCDVTLQAQGTICAGGICDGKGVCK